MEKENNNKWSFSKQLMKNNNKKGYEKFTCVKT